MFNKIFEKIKALSNLGLTYSVRIGIKEGQWVVTIITPSNNVLDTFVQEEACVSVVIDCCIKAIKENVIFLLNQNYGSIDKQLKGARKNVHDLEGQLHDVKEEIEKVNKLFDQEER
jgi:peptidoglycan hydrolase CwlO-like protein